jgi:hypothetical protein
MPPFRDQKPGRLLFLGRFGHRFLHALNGDRFLRCHHQRRILRGTLVSDRIGETLCRHPDKRALVGYKRRGARMWRTVMEELADRLTFVRSHCCDINESLHVHVPLPAAVTTAPP